MKEYKKERLKEHLTECLRNFFIIVTLINLAMYVIGLLFRSEQRFGYEVFIYPIIYGLLGSIPNLLIMEKKEPTVKQFLVRELMGFVMVTAIILTFMFAGQTLTTEHILIGAAVAVSVFVVFIGVNVITWILDSKTAKSMTDDLKAFQKKMAKEDWNK